MQTSSQQPTPPASAVGEEVAAPATVPPTAPAGAPATAPASGSAFARRIAGVFVTQVGLFGFALATSVVSRRLLTVDEQGWYSSVTLLPGTLSALGLIGLPAAANYFSGRRRSLDSLLRSSALFAVVLSVVLVGGAWLALPILFSSILSVASHVPDLTRVMLLVLPLSIVTAFGGSILYGRQAVRGYNLIQLAGAAMLLGAIVVLVGGFGLGVNGAVAASVLSTSLVALLVVAVLASRRRTDTAGEPARPRELLGYGVRLWPGTITGFFHYRADLYIMQAVLAGTTLGAAAVAQYTLAVTMAELVFYVPDSVGTLFLPRVAGSTPEEANRLVGRVGRFTTLLTIVAAVALVPAAFVGVHVVLPHNIPSLPAFVVLLPGVVSLSVAKVMGSFVNGRGRPGLVAFGTMVSVLLNVALNIVLIPWLGIVGASLSSLVSYSVQAAVSVFFASRLSGQSALSLFVPGTAEVRFLVDRSRAALRGRL